MQKVKYQGIFRFVGIQLVLIPCKMTFEGKGGKQHNASTLADKIGMGIHARITKSKKEDYPYFVTMIIVNQPWVELPDNPFGQPRN
jgi:hypothetical protein